MSDVSIRRGATALVRTPVRVFAALLLTVLLPLVAVGAMVGLGEPAGAQAAEEEAFFKALNETRIELGLPELTLNAELTDLSREWAAEMADEGEIFHANPISAHMTSDWLKLGENVGVGPKVDALMAAFIDSPTHYQNIIDPEFTHVGVGVVWEDELMFTTHRFMKTADLKLSTPTTSIPGDRSSENASPENASRENAGRENSETGHPTRPTSGQPGRPVAPPASEQRITVVVEALAAQAAEG